MRTWTGATGRGRAYPAGGFWDDPDLQALLWSYRDAELIQAVHRCRPVLREVDIWLLSNLPLPELPPAELLSLHELLGAPANTQPHKWNATMQAFERLAQELAQHKPVVSAPRPRPRAAHRPQDGREVPPAARQHRRVGAV